MKHLRSVVVFAVFGAALLASGALLERGLRPRPVSRSGERLFSEVVKLLERNYIDTLTTDSLFRSAVSGMLRELDDPHTAYLPPRRFERLAESTTGNYGGIGIEIDMRDAGIAVIAPLPNSPAEAARITTGDVITHVGGRPTAGWTDEEAARALRGAPGTTVSITVARPGVLEPLPFTLTRREVHREAIRRAIMLQQGVGYVDVDVFSEATVAELIAAIEKVRGEGAQSLLLDLRNNPGGLLEQGVAVSDLFLDRGDRVVEMRGRIPQANRAFSDTSRQRWPSMPLVVLVDGGSASASEIVAGALQDHDRAAIVGRDTYGKGSAQSLFRLPDGGALKVTTALWYTPSGRSINRPPGTIEEDPRTADLFAPIPEGNERPGFRTDGGRAVYGGGGIVPDVRVPRSAPAEVELAFRRAVGGDQARYVDALTEYAREARGKRAVTSPEFGISKPMLDDLWNLMRRRGITMSRADYDRASTIVTRDLESEVARYVFGPDAEFLRRSRRDAVISAALELAAGARDPAEVIARAGSRPRPAMAETPQPR